MANATKNYHRHPYHMVDPSPWPLVASFGAFLATSGGVMYMHGYSGGGFSLILRNYDHRLLYVCMVERYCS